jgi:hypothetical protein
MSVASGKTMISTSDIYSNEYSTIEVSTQIAKDLMALGKDASFNTLTKSITRNSAYLSEIEAAILRSKAPIDINETEEITVFGQTGIYANKSEIVNWKGEKSINEYPINEDNEPEVNKSI